MADCQGWLYFIVTRSFGVQRVHTQETDEKKVHRDGNIHTLMILQYEYDEENVLRIQPPDAIDRLMLLLAKDEKWRWHPSETRYFYPAVQISWSRMSESTDMPESQCTVAALEGSETITLWSAVQCRQAVTGKAFMESAVCGIVANLSDVSFSHAPWWPGIHWSCKHDPDIRPTLLSIEFGSFILNLDLWSWYS